MEKGELIATLYTGREAALPDAEQMVKSAYQWGETPPERQQLIYGVIR